MTHLSYVFLETSDTEAPDNEPQLESSKPLAQTDLPVLEGENSRQEW